MNWQNGTAQGGCAAGRELPQSGLNRLFRTYRIPYSGRPWVVLATTWALFFLSFLFTPALQAQTGWVSAVVDYQFGANQNFGQDSQYFPFNVLGPVAPTATAEAPASTPDEVVSLGRGGYISLQFDPPIADIPGPDFIVFENVLRSQFDSSLFTEWLLVAVSNDLSEWDTFAYDSLTGEGLAGRTPTNGAAAQDRNPATSGGDPFDLAELGYTQAKYVRVMDATRWQSADRLAAELDAIAVVDPNAPEPTTRPEARAPYRLVQAAGQWRLLSGSPVQLLACYDLSGRELPLPQLDPQGRLGINPEAPAQARILHFLVNGRKYTELIPSLGR